MTVGPVFWQLDREIDRIAPAARRPAPRAQLSRIAEEVETRQELRVLDSPSSQMGEKDRPDLNDVIGDLLQKN